jgi:hypothetical protein
MSERADANIEKSKSEMYVELVKDSKSLFYGFNQSDVYVAAAAVGYHDKKRIPISDRQGLFQVQNMKNQEGLWIIKSIGAATNGLESLESLKDAVSICSEYANYGIDVLYNMYKVSDNLIVETAEILMDLHESIC